MSIVMRNLLDIIIILCVCLNFGRSDGAKERGTCSQTILVSSLFPSSSSSSLSSCLLSSKASQTKSSLLLVHRHGPCSHLMSGKATTSPDHDEILRRDQARVDSIQSKLSKNQVRPSQLTDLPATQWDESGAGTYVVKIGIGTPKQDLSLLFDTGSDLTWVQCQPCLESKCYPQKEPLFNPSSSTSYVNVSCSSRACNSLRGLKGDCSASTCRYKAVYADKSTSQGFLATEKITLTNSDVFDVKFGCGDNNKGKYYGVAGILGLGRGELSFPSQTYNKMFSYCLPSSGNGGHLTFGSVGISESVKFTPISSSTRNWYSLEIVGITVCGKQLGIPSAVFPTSGAIIDSGTVITRLPQKAYAALKSAFKEKMSTYKITSSGDGSLDTCYDFTGLESVKIPRITFTFKGGNVVELDPKGILYSQSRSKVCLAFAGDDLAFIFGSIQQQTLQVVYDVAARRVGFAPQGCA
ncbi:hypothetical protein CARUB_v10002609mg [Capsella rubella]|uniref:Peptidase A1 domain-containing protein n=2 Tax=Capsella rubella TaxID=81985 RepID=R0GYT9_9BRAS|nr:hypothetical protein CARUB_v10002609mg [Capsella rubella]